VQKEGVDGSTIQIQRETARGERIRQRLDEAADLLWGGRGAGLHDAAPHAAGRAVPTGAGGSVRCPADALRPTRRAAAVAANPAGLARLTGAGGGQTTRRTGGAAGAGFEPQPGNRPAAR